MSTATTVGIEGWSAKRLLLAVSLVVAIAAGTFAAYALTGSAPAADTAPTTVSVDEASTTTGAPGILDRRIDHLRGTGAGGNGGQIGGLQP